MEAAHKQRGFRVKEINCEAPATTQWLNRPKENYALRLQSFEMWDERSLGSISKVPLSDKMASISPAFPHFRFACIAPSHLPSLSMARILRSLLPPGGSVMENSQGWGMLIPIRCLTKHARKAEWSGRLSA